MALENGQARRKRAWTWEEDMKLADYINKHGEGNWKSVGKAAGVDRNGKSCRHRWANYLRPDITKGAFSDEEKQLIIELHARHGNKWSLMADQLPGRTDNELKNFWNNRMRRKNPEILTLDNTNVQLPKKQLNSSGPSPFSSSMASTSCPLNNPYRPSQVGLCNTQENQLVPVSTYMNHHFNHFQSNYKDPFLNNGLSDSVPMPKRHQFDPNFCFNPHPNVEQPLIHSFLDFTPTTTTTASSSVDRSMTGNGTIFSADNNDKVIKVHGEGTTNVLCDELMSLIDSSSSSGPIPEWSDLGY